GRRGSAPRCGAGDRGSARGGGCRRRRMRGRSGARRRARPGEVGHRTLALARSGGRVTGGVVEHEGATAELSAPAVVVATGGFNNSAELVAVHAVEAAGAERVLLGGGRGARGEGLRMLEDVEAQFTQLDAVWMYPYGTPDPRDPEGARGLAV